MSINNEFIDDLLKGYESSAERKSINDQFLDDLSKGRIPGYDGIISNYGIIPGYESSAEKEAEDLEKTNRHRPLRDRSRKTVNENEPDRHRPLRDRYGKTVNENKPDFPKRDRYGKIENKNEPDHPVRDRYGKEVPYAQRHTGPWSGPFKI